MRAKVEKLLSRLAEVEKRLGDPDTVKDQQLYKSLTQEHSYLSKIKEASDYLKKTEEELLKNKELLASEKEGELLNLIKEEISSLEKETVLTEKKIQNLLSQPE